MPRLLELIPAIQQGATAAYPGPFWLLCRDDNEGTERYRLEEYREGYTKPKPPRYFTLEELHAFATNPRATDSWYIDE